MTNYLFIFTHLTWRNLFTWQITNYRNQLIDWRIIYFDLYYYNWESKFKIN